MCVHKIKMLKNNNDEISKDFVFSSLKLYDINTLKCINEYSSINICSTLPLYTQYLYIFLRKRKRNWEILQLRTNQMKLLREQQSSEKSATWQRNQQRLGKLRSKYYQLKKNIKTESSK